MGTRRSRHSRRPSQTWCCWTDAAGRDGVDVCRDIRAESGVPIVMLTAKTDTIDVVEGLEAGADDYVAKPFKAKELVARIKTRLRRMPASEEVDVETLRIGDLSISVDGHSVKRDGIQIQLTPLEFDLCWPWLDGLGRSSVARYCWNRCGATAMPLTPGWSTSTCNGCVPRSRRIPSTRRSW